jgi:hypothetical protein
MRAFVRIVFGLNAIYQLVVGGMALVTPDAVYKFYGAADVQPFMLGIGRGLGAMVVFGALVSAFIARDPDRDPVLLPLMGFLSVATVAAWTLALTAGELTMDQVGVDVLVQVALLAGVVAYYPRIRNRHVPAPSPEAEPTPARV